MSQADSKSEPSLPRAMATSEPQPSWLSKDFLRELKELPELRKLSWRVGKKPPEINNRREKVAACILATRGNVPAKPCTRCATGKGPMANCVALGNWLQGSCANCHFHGQGYQCSLRTAPDAQHDKPSAQQSPNSTSKRKAPLDRPGRRVDGDDAADQDLEYTPRKWQKIVANTSSRDLALGLAALESPESSSDENDDSEVAMQHASFIPPKRSDGEIPQASATNHRPPGFRCRRGKSISGIRSSTGRLDSINGKRLQREVAGNGSESHLNQALPVPSTARPEATRQMKPTSDIARTPQTSTPYHNGAVGAEVSGTAAKLPAVPIIDTLSKAQQRQIYGILSGIDGGMSHIQKQFKALQNLLGVDIDVE